MAELSQKDRTAKVIFFILLAVFISVFAGVQIVNHVQQQNRQDKFVCDYVKASGYAC